MIGPLILGHMGTGVRGGVFWSVVFLIFRYPYSSKYDVVKNTQDCIKVSHRITKQISNQLRVVKAMNTSQI